MSDPTAPAGGARTTLDELARATPHERDRYVDFLRAVSILVVVLGHWLIAVVRWEGDELTGINALDVIPELWIATWLLQVMPLFFFVGGFSNLVTYRALRRLSEGPGAFLQGRAARLLRPTAVFVSVLTVALFLLSQYFEMPDGSLRLAIVVLPGPLWFLGVYLFLVALTPPMEWLHRHLHVWVPVGLLTAVVLVDLARFATDLEWVGLFNLIFVWLFVHQLGFFYADGDLKQLPALVVGLATLAGLLGVIALTSMDLYPGSMVGRPSDPISNMAPPTVPMAAMAIWQIGLVLLARSTIDRLLSRTFAWKAVIAVNASIMTLFLWHLSAMALTVAVAYPLGFPQHEPGTMDWWLARIPWLTICAVFLALLVWVFGRFERADLDPAESYWDLRHFHAL